jgi:hypothetical protein
MTTVQITTQTDLTNGGKTFILPANPVPVITPIGPAPGELQITTEASGRVTSVRAVLRPKGADVAEMADVLASLASFNLQASELRGLAGSQPIVTFALRADAIADIHVTVKSPNDVLALLEEAVLQSGERYAVADLEVSA